MLSNDVLKYRNNSLAIGLQNAMILLAQKRIAAGEQSPVIIDFTELPKAIKSLCPKRHKVNFIIL